MQGLLVLLEEVLQVLLVVLYLLVAEEVVHGMVTVLVTLMEEVEVVYVASVVMPLELELVDKVLGVAMVLNIAISPQAKQLILLGEAGAQAQLVTME
jgi:hypothetical protein